MNTEKKPVNILTECDDWPAFTVPWDDISKSPTDMSRFLPKPAGGKGFIKSLNGHLATGDDQRWRFWGVGMVFSSWFPPTHLAGIVARRLAKFGINCLRLHHLDHRWPSGILKRYDDGWDGPGRQPPGRYAHPGKNHTRELDPEAMARLDWFIYCCKQNGVYVDFNLNVTRRFSSGDGVKDSETLGFSKGITYFDPWIIQLEKEYARNLLTHVNPFTGNRYADEPCVAMIEILNENSLVYLWHEGKLDENNEAEKDGTWRNIPPVYSRDLTKRYNRFIAEKYTDRESLMNAWGGDLRPYEDAASGTIRRLTRAEFEKSNTVRFHDEAQFYYEIEEEFFKDMESFLRGELGVKQLIVSTSDWGHRWSALPSLKSESSLDIMDGHAYWDPSFHKSWAAQHHYQVDDPDQSMPAKLSRTLVKNRPYIVSEINESFPNDPACEMFPLVTAYALLQDWDGFFWHSYTGGHFDWDNIWQNQSIGHHLRLSSDPMKMTQLAIAGMMFHRGDIQAARETIERTYTWSDCLESLRHPLNEFVDNLYWRKGLPGRISLIHRTHISDFNAAETMPKIEDLEIPHGQLVSDTGELIWEEKPGDGRVLINAPRHQAVIMRKGVRSTTNMSVDLSNQFSAVELASLDDDQPISTATNMLLVAAGRVANTEMRWTDETRTSINGSVGHAPTRIEPVHAVIRLTNLLDAKAVFVQPLDERGQPFGVKRDLVREGDQYLLNLPLDPITPWCLITVWR